MARGKAWISDDGRRVGEKHPLYPLWLEMRTRCRSTRSKSFKNYGGRGIRVCERWERFDLFVADMGPRPKGYTLDRIDNDGNYEPGNCRWASRLEQNRNSRQCRYYEVDGVRMTTKELWALKACAGLSYEAFVSRIHISGWPLDKALNTPCLIVRKRAA